ncbi:type III restriction enzyme, res subunit [candidate division TM7 genomosp. GTL1]|nr:type III restriction enzyme, res subunit [candidate division TM7 genomosp. GTL1]
MKLQFEPNQQYQLDAIQAVVDVFSGQPQDSDSVVGGHGALELAEQLSLETMNARGNRLLLSSEQIIKNVHEIQEYFGLSQSEVIQAEQSHLAEGNNFTVEMETGTGKTYVYLRTIHELHENYGWKKFIIVVPSVAVREGVLKNLEITKDHFAELYGNPEMNHYVWDTKKTGQAREFATNDTLQIMVITIDSFAKNQNIMNKTSDYGRPLDFIKATHPVVIIDEPQNMETDIRKKAIQSLNPLCILRYSATHKHPYNMLYCLTPVDAYDKGLVKKIEVHSVYSEDSYNDAYISVLGIERSGKSRLLAKVELDTSDDRGLQRKVIKIAPGDDLLQVTKRSVYEGYVVEAIDHANQALEFANGKILYVGQKDEGLHEEILKRQIELTIEDHFEKQKRLSAENAKVLSLFFIDRVANYREYTGDGFVKGKFAHWFEEAYAKISSKYAGVMDGLNAKDVHGGYFAADKFGNWKDSKDTKGEGAKTRDDDAAYSLIMRDKERLLDMNEPLRFIFSHSALREGWDNPNVFTICTLNETSSEMKKRQEIGRGLRLPVNATGERIRDENINILTVVANESYADFSRKLQTDIEEETGISFGAGRIKNREDRRRVKLQKNVMLDPAFQELWERVKYKTTYRVTIDERKLVDEVVKDLENISISRPQFTDIRTTIEKMGDNGFKTHEIIGIGRASKVGIARVPNVLEQIQARTYLTRKVIFDILDASKMFDRITINPQQAIDEVSWATNRVKHRQAIDGIKYEKTGDSYGMELFENKELETFLYDVAAKRGAIEVEKQDKTLYDYVPVDSEIEYEFMKSLERTENVKFYIKLPNWFKIDTPLGPYNPDWAVAFDGDSRVYFVAETKSVNSVQDESLRDSERQRLIAGKSHFEVFSDVQFIAPTNSLADALKQLK